MWIIQFKTPKVAFVFMGINSCQPEITLPVLVEYKKPQLPFREHHRSFVSFIFLYFSATHRSFQPSSLLLRWGFLVDKVPEGVRHVTLLHLSPLSMFYCRTLGLGLLWTKLCNLPGCVPRRRQRDVRPPGHVTRSEAVARKQFYYGWARGWPWGLFLFFICYPICCCPQQ